MWQYNTNVVIELHDLESQKADMEIPDESTIREYHDLRQQIETYTKDMHDVITHPNYCLRFLQPGRLVTITHGGYDFGWGVVITYTRRESMKDGKLEDLSPHQSWIVDVLMPVSDSTHIPKRVRKDVPNGMTPPEPDQKGKMEVIPVTLSCIDKIGQLRLFLPKDLTQPDKRNSVRKSIDELKRRFPDGLATLDALENMGITDDSFKKLLRVSGPRCVHDD